MKSSKNRFFASAAAVQILFGCTTMPLAPPLEPDRVLILVSCPERSPLLEDSFGAWVNKTFELAQQYDECRKAALSQ